MSLDTSDRRSGAYRSVTRLVIALMATLFVIGCGSSRGEYVHPGPGPGPGVNTGTLIFNFETLAQTSLNVPYTASDISRVKFELFDANHVEIPNSPRSELFGNQITLFNVPVSVEHVDLTFYDEFNFPLFTAEVDVDVFADQITVVDFTGVVGEVPTFDALTVNPDPLALDSGESSQPLSVSAAFGNGEVVPIPATDLNSAGVIFISDDSAVATVDADGVVTGVASGSTVITAELTTNGATHSDTVNVVVDAAIGVLDYITVEPATLTVLLSGGDQQLTVTGFDALDNEVVIDLADFDIASSNVAVLTVDDTGLITPVAAGAATVTVTNTADPTITASSEITVSAATVDSIDFVDADGVAITEPLELYVSEAGALSVTANLSDNTTIANFEDLGHLTITAGEDHLNFVDGELIALQETGAPFLVAPETVTFEVDPAVSTGGTAVTEDIDVEVRRVQLTDVAVSIGGIEVDLTATSPSASIPVGYTGVVEIVGTFEDGSSRILSGDENDYRILIDTGTDFTRVTPSGFQTNEAITANLSLNAEDTLTIEFNPDRDGDLVAINIALTAVGSTFPTGGAFATFANYSDDLRLIQDGPAREIDLRVNFTALSNFRIAYEDIHQIAGTTNVSQSESFGHWPMLSNSGGTLGGPADVDIEFGPGGSVHAGSASIKGVTSVVPTFFGIEPDSVTPYITPGQWASFSTFVDYDDGEGLVNRSAEYPVFEQYYDFIDEVYVTLDTAVGVSNFFLKRIPSNPPLNVRIVDLTGAPQSSIGAGVATVQFTN